MPRKMEASANPIRPESRWTLNSFGHEGLFVKAKDALHRAERQVPTVRRLGCEWDPPTLRRTCDVEFYSAKLTMELPLQNRRFTAGCEIAKLEKASTFVECGFW